MSNSIVSVLIISIFAVMGCGQSQDSQLSSNPHHHHADLRIDFEGKRCRIEVRKTYKYGDTGYKRIRSEDEFYTYYLNVNRRLRVDLKGEDCGVFIDKAFKYKTDINVEGQRVGVHYKHFHKKSCRSVSYSSKHGKWGSIAYSKPDNILGVAYKWNHHSDSVDASCRRCEKAGGEDCQVRIAAKNTCLSLAISNDRSVVKTASAGDYEQAKQSARHSCELAATTSCTVKKTICSYH